MIAAALSRSKTVRAIVAAAAASELAAAESASAAARRHADATEKALLKATAIANKIEAAANEQANTTWWSKINPGKIAAGIVAAVGPAFAALTYYRSQEAIPRIRLKIVNDDNSDVLGLENTGAGVLRVREISFAYSTDTYNDWNPLDPKVKQLANKCHVEDDVTQHLSYASVHNGHFEVAPQSCKPLIAWKPKKVAPRPAGAANKHCCLFAEAKPSPRLPTDKERKAMVKKVRRALFRVAARVVYVDPLGLTKTAVIPLNQAVPMSLLRCAWEFDSTVVPTHSVVRTLYAVRKAQIAQQAAREAQWECHSFIITAPDDLCSENHRKRDAAQKCEKLARMATISAGAEALCWFADPAKHKNSTSKFAKAAVRVRDAVDVVRRCVESGELSPSKSVLDELGKAVAEWKGELEKWEDLNVTLLDGSVVAKKIETAKNKLGLKVIPNKKQQEELRAVATACIDLVFNNGWGWVSAPHTSAGVTVDARKDARLPNGIVV